MKKNEQHHQTDLKLLEAFKAILQRDNNKKLSVDNICREANVHHQTFYQHFASKEEFYTFSINIILDQCITQIKNGDNQLLMFLKLFAQSLKKHRRLYYQITKNKSLSHIFSNQLNIIFTQFLTNEYPKMSNDELIFLQGGLIAIIIHYLSIQLFDEQSLEHVLDNLIEQLHKNYLILF